MSGWTYPVILVLPAPAAGAETERYERAMYDLLEGGALSVATQAGQTIYAPGAWIRLDVIGAAVKE